MAGTINFSRLNLTRDLHPGYELVRLRGVGGFGEVWEAQSEDGRRLALKFLRCTHARGGAAMELRSLQAVQTLRHLNLMKIERVWCAGSFLVIAMELADGSFADLLDVYREERGGAMPANHLLPLMAQAAKAIDFMNNRQHLINGERVGIQHCDINPSNILLIGDTVKLSDFSLTTVMNSSVKAHRMAGTVAYAAPEIFNGTLTNRTDQYALAVCYCKMRGSLPFKDSPETFEASYTRPVPDLTMLTAAERPALSRALTPAPEHRWPTCWQFIKELHLSTSTPITASAPQLKCKSSSERSSDPAGR